MDGFIEYKDVKKQKDIIKNIYNPQMTAGKPYKNKAGVLNKNYNSVRKESNDDAGMLRYPKSVLKFNSECHTIHSTQKPVLLLEYLIKTYSHEKDLVLDFTMGSGSTGVACRNTKRQFIGIEMDKDIYYSAVNRLW